MLSEYLETSTIHETNENKEFWINQEFITKN